MLKEKELKDISISEIATTAKVSRISFYRNYADIFRFSAYNVVHCGLRYRRNCA